MTKYLYSKRGIFRDTGAVLPPKQHTRCFHPQGHTCRCKILEHKWGSGPAAEQDSQGVRWHGRPGVRARAKAPEPRAAAVTPATGPPDTQGSGLGASARVRAPPPPPPARSGQQDGLCKGGGPAGAQAEGEGGPLGSSYPRLSPCGGVPPNLWAGPHVASLQMGAPARVQETGRVDRASPSSR